MADPFDVLCHQSDGWAQWLADRLTQLIGVEGKTRAEARAIIQEEEAAKPWERAANPSPQA